MDDLQPQFDSRRFLERHVRDTLAFYQPNGFDPDGGLFTISACHALLCSEFTRP